MNTLPGAAQRDQIAVEYFCNPNQFPASEPVILAQFDRAGRTLQFIYRFMAHPNGVNMRRTVIVRIDNNPKSAVPQNSWHRYIVSLTKALRLFGL